MGFKLLLADDSITIQKVVSIIFADEEYELTIVDNGDAALGKAAEVIPDIMLVDTLMPGTSGYDVCRNVRQDSSLRNVPVLLLTGAFEPFDVEKARESGADDFISKPFESQVLIEKVKSLVQLGQERKSAPAAEPVSVPAPEPQSSPEDRTWAFDPTPELPTEAAAVSASAGIGQSENVWDVSEFFAEPAPSAGEVSFAAEEAEETAPGGEPPLADLEEPFAVEETAPSTADAVFEAPGGAVEVTHDDDLWGAFELDSSTGRQEDPVDILETCAAEPEDMAQSMFSEGPTAENEGLVGAASDEPPSFGAVWGELEDAASQQPVDDGPALLAQEEPGATESPFGAVISEPAYEMPVADVGIKAEPPSEGYFFAEPAQTTPLAAFDADEGRTLPPEEPAMPVAAPAAVEGVVQGLTEDQLAAVISRISRDVIEKIVWEVVPDLAETLIKEEIRRIKEGR